MGLSSFPVFFGFWVFCGLFVLGFDYVLLFIVSRRWHLYCDAHIHLLPDLDNGPCAASEALFMLRAMQDNGCRHAVLTPHFYHDRETVSSFLSRRNTAFASLLSLAEPISRFLFALSAEVHISPGVSRLSQLERLLIPHTRFLPVELPIGRLDDFVIRELSHIIHKRNIQPIICQTERHFLLYTSADYEKLVSLPHALYAFSAPALLNRDIITEIVRLVTSDHRVLVGSNAHNMQDRRPIDRDLEDEISRHSATVYKMLCLQTAAYLKPAFS